MYTHVDCDKFRGSSYKRPAIEYDYSFIPLTINNPNFSTPSRTNNTFATFNPPSYLSGWLHDQAMYQGRGTGGAFTFPSTGRPVEFTQYAIVHQVRNLYQSIYMDVGTHILEVYAVGRPSYGSNIITITVDGQVVENNWTVGLTEWIKYTFQFAVTVAGTKQLMFQGNDANGSTAITGISMSRRVLTSSLPILQSYPSANLDFQATTSYADNTYTLIRNNNGIAVPNWNFGPNAANFNRNGTVGGATQTYLKVLGYAGSQFVSFYTGFSNTNIGWISLVNPLTVTPLSNYYITAQVGKSNTGGSGLMFQVSYDNINFETVHTVTVPYGPTDGTTILDLRIPECLETSSVFQIPSGITQMYVRIRKIETVNTGNFVIFDDIKIYKLP